MKSGLRISGLAVALIGLAYACDIAPAHSFELTPKPTKSEEALAKKQRGILFRATYPIIEFGLHTFSTAVHEGLTHLAYDCPLETLSECADPDLDAAAPGVIVGVRWNDNPPFQFASGQGKYKGCSTQIDPPPTISFALAVDCWYAHFKDVSAKAEAKPDTYITGRGTLLARSHFGDLQFLHAMATRAGIPAEETKQKILMWAEFTWKVQSHDKEEWIAPVTRMGTIPVPGMLDHFPKQEIRDIENLFTVGRTWVRHQLRDIAFGSFLHMVQDSFAGGHVARRARADAHCSAPEIVEFHSYPGQVKAAHKAGDSLESATAKAAGQGASLVDVLKKLVWFRERDALWTQVRPYLDSCVFRLGDGARVSSTDVSE
jgi:hypothetical protein